MNVVIYARYSNDNQSETSIEQQLKVCYEYCMRNKHTIISEYKDIAISGRTDERPQFQKMIKDSKRSIFQGIVIYSVDRFGRTMHQTAAYANELEKNNVMLLSATEHISGGPSGKLTLNMLMAFAQYYSDELGQKIKRGLDYNAERGYVTTGTIPLGYKSEPVDSAVKDGKKKYAIDETTAPIVKRIYEMYADEGMTMTQITQSLNEQGYRSSRGALFNKNSLRTFLRNKWYIGVYTYAEHEYPGLIPRIIEDDLFERVQQSLTKNKKAPAKNKAVGENAYLLTLRLFCGHCKELMTGWSGTGKSKKLHRYYMCNGKKKNICKKKNIRKERIEDIVVEQCRKTLTDKNIEKIATDIIAFNENEQRNNENLKRLETLIANNKKQHNSLMGTLKLCEDEDTKRLLLSEMSQMLKELKDLQIQFAIEESRKVKITRREIIFFLKDLQNGDISDSKYRKTLITVLINKIYIYDDGRLTILFYNGDTTTEIDIGSIDMIEKDIPAEINNRGYFLGDTSSVNSNKDEL
jgi:DNA invertase Pin-like site-specific DNA recombinase